MGLPSLASLMSTLGVKAPKDIPDQIKKFYDAEEAKAQQNRLNTLYNQQSNNTLGGVYGGPYPSTTTGGPISTLTSGTTVWPTWQTPNILPQVPQPPLLVSPPPRDDRIEFLEGIVTAFQQGMEKLASTHDQTVRELHYLRMSTADIYALKDFVENNDPELMAKFRLTREILNKLNPPGSFDANQAVSSGP